MKKYLLLMLSLCLSLPAWSADLKINDLVTGEGEEAALHDSVKVHYTGWLEDGTKFDSSLDRGTPFTLVLGAGQVIPGWEMGLTGMRVGGQRELIIPPQLAYGPRGAGGVIPPNATLRFEVELLAIEPPPFSNVGNGELSKLIESGVKVIDIRRPEEWRETGVVEGSYLLTAFDDRGNFVRDFPGELDRLVDKDETFVMICRTGSRTGYLARALAEQAGYEHVVNVTDGITRWIADGGPVKKNCPSTTAGSQC